MMQSFVASALLLTSFSYAITIPFVPPPIDVLTAEGLPAQAYPLLASFPNGGAVDRTGFVYTADSAQSGNGIYNTMDGDSKTIWHTMYSPTLAQLPHTITIDTKQLRNIDGITYRPRQDGSSNGNIGQHKIYSSTDGVNWGDPVAYGTWFDDATEKTAAWETKPARYIMIKAITEAGNRGPWSSAAEFYIYTASTYTAPVNGLGAWGPTINFPLVPVAAAVMPDSGNVLTWSSYTSASFTGSPGGKTLTSVWNYNSKIVSQRVVTNTQHDMFCPGISFTVTGTVVITGGNDNLKTSIYNGGADSWTPGSNMYQGRGYQSQVTMGDGKIFTIGGSWSGGQGGKNGEYYVPGTNTWFKLPGATVAQMLTADNQGVYRADNHAWLFNWKNNVAFQAGPSKAMNWYTVSGTGARSAAGTRGDDTDSMCGNAVMYDAAAGKIVTFGGATSYQGYAAHAKAHIITLGNSNAAVTTTNINPMWFSRIFHTSVVLPDGKVFIAGGQTTGNPFSDAGSILTPELWLPTTNAFQKMLPNTTPRNYHSFSLLLLDGTVMVGGGGLCGTCSTNHFDAQIYTPQYLLNADGTKRTRPVINSISAWKVAPGTTITVNTNSAVSSFAMIRYGTATHTVNTDQRRIPLAATAAGTNTYKITLGPANSGQVTPGYWMLFALTSSNTPSTATTILITV